MPSRGRERERETRKRQANFFHALVKNVNISCGLMRALRQQQTQLQAATIRSHMPQPRPVAAPYKLSNPHIVLATLAGQKVCPQSTVGCRQLRSENLSHSEAATRAALCISQVRLHIRNKCAKFKLFSK